VLDANVLRERRLEALERWAQQILSAARDPEQRLIEGSAQLEVWRAKIQKGYAIDGHGVTRRRNSS
jgi:hypothetical protein